MLFVASDNNLLAEVNLLTSGKVNAIICPSPKSREKLGIMQEYPTLDAF